MSGNMKKNKRVWLVALVLFVCVATTTIAVVNIFNGFKLDSSGAIDLVDGNEPSDDKVDDSTGSDVVEDVVVYHPDFQVSDGKGVWHKNTSVELFSIAYGEDGEKVSIASNDGSNVIAPGATMSYSFKFKNSGDVALDYAFNVDAYVSHEDIEIPVVARVSRYDGKWVTGSEEEFVDITILDKVKDSSTLAAGRYTYYTLEWMWPFEGNDELDTLLGNLAVDEEITVSIKLNTVAAVSSSVGSGIIDTGDSSGVDVWLITAGLSLLVLLFLLIYRRDDEEDSESGAM